MCWNLVSCMSLTLNIFPKPLLKYKAINLKNASMDWNADLFFWLCHEFVDCTMSFWLHFEPRYSECEEIESEDMWLFSDRNMCFWLSLNEFENQHVNSKQARCTAWQSCSQKREKNHLKEHENWNRFHFITDAKNRSKETTGALNTSKHKVQQGQGNQDLWV